jgi:predicted nucleotidyltransferase
VDHEALAAVCQRYGVARLWVFGSVARGEARTDSDIDLLYELLPDRRLGWELVDLIDELSRLLGRPVDLIARDAIHPLIRDAVLREARALHAA